MTEKALEQKIADCENAICSGYENFKNILNSTSKAVMHEAQNQAKKQVKKEIWAVNRKLILNCIFILVIDALAVLWIYDKVKVLVKVLAAVLIVLAFILTIRFYDQSLRKAKEVKKNAELITASTEKECQRLRSVINYNPKV